MVSKRGEAQVWEGLASDFPLLMIKYDKYLN